MAKNSPRPGFERFEHRHGLTIGWPRGIKRQGDASRLTPEQFWSLQNVRIAANQIVSRGGCTKVNTTPEAGCITGIFDSGD